MLLLNFLKCYHPANFLWICSIVSQCTNWLPKDRRRCWWWHMDRWNLKEISITTLIRFSSWHCTPHHPTAYGRLQVTAFAFRIGPTPRLVQYDLKHRRWTWFKGGEGFHRRDKKFGGNLFFQYSWLENLKFVSFPAKCVLFFFSFINLSSNIRFVYCFLGFLYSSS